MRRVLKDHGLGFLVAIVLCVLLEGLLQLAVLAKGGRSVDEPPYGPSADLGWERLPGFQGRVADKERAFDRDGYLTIDSAQVADTAARRVLFVGDSNTFGYGVRMEETFAEATERALPGVAAINVGAQGYSSYQGRVALSRHLARIRPSAVVASFNFNDRRYVFPGQEDGAARMAALASASPLESLASFRFGRLLLSKTTASREINVTTVRPRVDEAAYRRNLTAIAEMCQRAGIPLIFVLLRDNPVQTYHLRQGLAALERGEHGMAVAHLSVAATTANWFQALARLHLAEAYRRRNQPTADAERYTPPWPVNSSMGALPIRMEHGYHAAMRDVARVYEIPVVDAPAQPDEYIDFCHVNPAGHARIGHHVARQLTRLLARRSS